VVNWREKLGRSWAEQGKDGLSMVRGWDRFGLDLVMAKFMV
jgi:hypothetical protein